MNRIMQETDLDSWKHHLTRQEKSPVTIEKYMRDIRRFQSYIQDQEFTKETVIGYKHHLIAQGYASASVNSMLAALNSFLDFKGVPQCKLKYLRQQKQAFCPESRELTRQEYFRLLQAAHTQPRMQMALQAICATGIRVSELKYFTVEQVQKGEIPVKCKNKIRIIFIPELLRVQLLDYARQCSINSGLLFITHSGKPLDRSYLWAYMKQLCTKAEVNPEKVYPHNLRKLFARTFYSYDKDIAKLADVLGHESIETTRIYIKTSGAEHRQILDRLALVAPGSQTAK